MNEEKKIETYFVLCLLLVVLAIFGVARNAGEDIVRLREDIKYDRERIEKLEHSIPKP